MRSYKPSKQKINSEKDISSKLQQGQLQDKNPYYKEDGILKDLRKMENKSLT